MVTEGNHTFPRKEEKYISKKYFILTIFVQLEFLSDPGVLGVQSMGPVVCHRPFADLTDVTLVDEDIKSILTDNANRAIQGNQAMCGVQIY